MKKFVGIVSIIILLCLELLTPFTYAGDFLEDQNFDWINNNNIEIEKDEWDLSITSDVITDKAENSEGEGELTVDDISSWFVLPLDSGVQSESEINSGENISSWNNREFLERSLEEENSQPEENSWFIQSLSEIVKDLFQTDEEEKSVFESNEIHWIWEYRWVTVDVYAATWLFESWTQLLITPVVEENLDVIQETLLSWNVNLTEESTVVAFDISFIFSWEEVQPTSWTVQVSFNYEQNEEIKLAEEDKEQEVKIYHLNDKDEDWNVIDEVNIENVEIVENSTWEVMVEAESFSVYTIVTQVAEEWPLAETENQLANFVYWEISIEDPDNPWYWITIMDRNLWALKSWTWDEYEVKGYLYQWWNNYGFPNNWELINISSDCVDTSEYWLDNQYYGKTYITIWASDWSCSSNPNLWWWGDDYVWHWYRNYWVDENKISLNPLDRQWPCPTWWHVPSMWERGALTEWRAEQYRLEGNSINVSWHDNKIAFISNDQLWVLNFRNYFKIPLVYGRETYNNWTVNIHTSNYFYHTSTANWAWVHPLVITSSSTNMSYWYWRSKASPVRCFKNTYSWTGATYIVTYDFNWWSWSVASQFVKSWDFVEKPTNPVKKWLIFSWWYLSWTDDEYTFTSPVDQTISLYAKWREPVKAYLKKWTEFKSILSNLAWWLNNINEIRPAQELPLNLIKSWNVANDGWLSVVAWYDNTSGTWIIYYYSNADVLYMNTDSSSMFNWMNNLISVDLKNTDTSDVTTMDEMFNRCYSLKKIIFGNRNLKKLTSVKDMFFMCNNLEYLDLSDWYNTENIRDMSRMFYEDTSLREIYFGENFKTDSVINMENMFQNCNNLIELDLSYRDVSNVISMTDMFNRCTSLEKINLGNRNSRKVESMFEMFNRCYSLREIIFNNWETESVQNMSDMFYMNSSLEKLDLSSFDTSNVTNMSNMFHGCTWLVMLNLSSFDTSSVTNMTNMFREDEMLKTIYVSDSFNTDKVTNSDNIFSYANSLIWWNGTWHYNSDNFLLASIEYAQIDNETQSWYFTDPSHFKVNFISTTWVILSWQRISTWQTISLLNDATKEYTYYSDKDLTTLFDTWTQLYSYTEIYVDIKDKYKVEFNTMWWTPEVEAQRVTSWWTIVEPIESQIPNKKRYNFIWWFEDPEWIGESFDFSKPITWNKILYAKWEEKLCVTYSINWDKVSITWLNPDEECKENLAIPNMIENKQVTRIESNAFKNKWLSWNLIFKEPSNLEWIWQSAFQTNKLEWYLEIPDTVNTIWNECFYWAFNQNTINTLKLWEWLKTLWKNAFRDNKFTWELILPEGLNWSIGELTFNNNNFNWKLTIPSWITSINWAAFQFNKFTELDLSNANSLESIWQSAFQTNKLEWYLEIPDTVTYIWSECFYWAFNQNTINTLKLWEWLKTLWKNAFRDDKFTWELILPEGLTWEIGEYTFNNNNFNWKLTIPSWITSINRAAFQFNKFTELDLSNVNSLISVWKSAFWNNSLSGVLIIPNTIKNIGENVFELNSIKEVYFQSWSNISLNTSAFCYNWWVVQWYKNWANITIDQERPSCINLNEKSSYTVTYETYWWISLENESVLYWETITNISPVKTWYDFKWWYLTWNIFFPNTTPIISDIKLYALFQKDIIFKLIWNWNNILSWSNEVDEFIQTWTVYNNVSEYSFTFPWIKPNINTPRIIWYSSWATIHEWNYQSWDTITLSWSQTFYAQTMEEYNSRIWSFIKWTGVDSLGDNKSEIKLTCTLNPTYNWNRYDSCSIHSPSINLKPWYENPKFNTWGTEYDVNTDITISSDKTFIAKWTPINYKITYVLNSWTLEDKKENYTVEEWFTIWNPTREGYDFAWWTWTMLTEKRKDLEITTWTIGNLLLYANYTPNIYSIKFIYSWEEKEQLISYDELTVLDKNTFTKTWYTFSWWYDEGNNIRYVDQQFVKNLTAISWAQYIILLPEWNPNTYKIRFHSNTNNEEMYEQNFIYDEWEKALSWNTFINTWYVFKFWNTENKWTGTNYEDNQLVENLTSTNNTTINLYAQWGRLIKVEFKDWDTLLTGYEIESWDILRLPENPVKAWYDFIGWDWLPEDMIAWEDDIIVQAQRKSSAPIIPQPAAWWWRIINSEYIKEKIEQIKQNEHNAATQWTGNEEKQEDEESVYQWAYQHNITTLPTLERANPDGVVLRWHLAKMLVNYADNVLWYEIPEKIPYQCRWNDWKTDRESQEIKEYAEKACALGLMWIDMEKFLPNMEVTRAQFWTIISRLLWWKKYAWWTPYYKKHLNALKENNIMTQIEKPEKRIEMRKRVWLMLMRSFKTNEQ